MTGSVRIVAENIVGGHAKVDAAMEHPEEEFVIGPPLPEGAETVASYHQRIRVAEQAGELALSHAA